MLTLADNLRFQKNTKTKPENVSGYIKKNDTMESNNEIKYIFGNVNEWLKFAEAKHAGLIVFNAGLVVGILSSYQNIHTCLFKPVVLIGMICFGLSIFLSIISLFPVTQNIFFNRKEITNPNIYFFGHLANMSKDDFVNELQNVDANYQDNRLDADLINQILINSRITTSKYLIFKYASYLTAFGFGLIGFSTVIKVIWHF